MRKNRNTGARMIPGMLITLSPRLSAINVSHVYGVRKIVVLVEDGPAARTMATYIDLNPVRAGMVEDPVEYRWSSFGEAMGGGTKGNGKKRRAGLVRALMAHKGYAADARHWAGKVSKDYRMMLLAEGEERLREVRGAGGGIEVKVVSKEKGIG
ncbi:MAG: hypothetical protein NTW21_32010 [Verrucomicrobia bacterium]|nr:hypothetical protein [Verrucomicrobiota bacterium]